MDFDVISENGQLNDFFTALPPQYIKWLDKTKITGKTDLLFELKGDYIAEENKKPSVHFNMKIREGFIAHQNTPLPAKNLFLNFDTRLPSLDVEQLAVKIDSIYFEVGKDFLNGNVLLNELSIPKIEARIRLQMDLAKLNQALGIPIKITGNQENQSIGIGRESEEVEETEYMETPKAIKNDSISTKPFEISPVQAPETLKD